MAHELGHLWFGLPDLYHLVGGPGEVWEQRRWVVGCWELMAAAAWGCGTGAPTLDYRFKLRNGDHAVLASYTGIVPDTFKDGAEIVLTGQLGPQGFHATDMTAKCPSKYEAAGPPAPTVR